MTRELKKITALVMCVMLIFSMMPTYSFALDDVPALEGEEESAEETLVAAPEGESAEEIVSEEYIVAADEADEASAEEVAEMVTSEASYEYAIEEIEAFNAAVAESETNMEEELREAEISASEETPEEKIPAAEAVSEEVPAEEVTTEEAEETAGEDYGIDPNKQFRYRLLVGFGGSINTREEDAVLGTFDDVALLGFDSAEELNAAQRYYESIAIFASIDGAVNASTNESAPTNVDTASASAQADSASANDNPLAAASEETTPVISGKNTIALVDTGAGGFNVITTLSVLGDNGADSNGHGTGLASIIAIENPNAKIISIKALDGNGKGSVASVYAGVKLAIESGVDIIVLPFSARGYSAAIESIINEAIAKEIYVVVAAGNDAADASGYCPANVWSAITVGALNAEGEIAGFSNSGSYVDAWAIADSTSEASAKVAAGLSLGKDIAEYQMGTEATEEEEPTEEEVEEFETAYNTTSDSVVDGGVYIIRLRKDPKRSIVQYTGTLENGNKFVLSNGEKREDSSGQFKVQKINYNFYIKLRDNTNYIMSPEGGASYVSSNGTKVHMWYKTSSNYKDFDQWWLKSVDNGKYYRITNGTNTGMHLQTEGGNTAGATAIHLWNATSGTQGDWIFERVHYYVKFNGNGNTGGSMSSQKIWQEVGTALTANAFSKTGYTFNGWNTNSSGTGTNYSNQQKVTCLTTTNAATVNLYAKWKANTYSVKYDGNESTSGSMSNSSHTYDASKALTSNAYSKTGYTFNGWNTKADGTGTAYADGASVKNLTSTNGGTVTLYAQWKANTWYVEYNGNGNTSGSTAKSTHTYDTAKNLTNNGFTKTGYSFNGWNTKADGTGTAYSNGASVKNLTSTNGGTITVYAQWKANNYVITLDGQNATSEGTKSAYYTFDTAKYYSDSEHKAQIESIEVPARTGYEFGGYYASPNGAGAQYITAAGAFVNNPHKVASDKTLYAKWTAKTYTVSLDANGGKLAGSSISDSTEEEATATATFDETFTLHHPVREGYTFAGWTISGMEAEVTHSIGTHTSTDASADDVVETTFKNLRAEAGTVNFVAKWTANTYTVRYDANGGTLAEGTENPYAATFDESFSVKAPTRAGYVFMGWKITGMDGAHHVIAGTEVTDHTYTYSVDEADEKVILLNLRGQKGEVEVTAIWADDKYEVSYDLNGGVHEDVAQDEVKSYDYNKTFHLANPTKAGYKFTGWTIAGMDAGTTHIAGGEETTAEELTAVMGTSFGKLNANGGSVTMTATWKAADITVVLVAPDATNDYTKEINYTYKDNSGYYQDAEHKTALSSPVTVPTRENYTFTGFYENTDAEGTAVIPADGTIPESFYEKYTQATNLYAGWEASVYEITLSQNGATEEGTKKIYEKYAEGVFEDSEAAIELDAIEVPSRELLVTFDANADGDVQDPDNMSANAKFAGYFDGETMLIATSGKLTPAFAATYFTAAKTLTVKWDDAIIKLPALPERENYTFDGWFTEAFGGTKVGNAGDEYAFSDNEELYAHWNLDPDLYYEGNGGEGGEMAATIAKGKTITPVECGYTKAGYSFVEWNTKADGTGTAYKAGVKTVWNEDLGTSEHYTLYAQWEQNEFDHIKAIANMKYTGNAIMPKLTVYDKNGDVVSADDYTLTWNNNIKVGTATVTVVAKAGGNFAESESVSAEFNIVKANAEYFEVKAENYAGIYDGTNHAIKATAKTEDEGHAYKIGYGKTEAEAKAAAEAKTASATTNSGYDVETVADSGIYFYYIIPDNYEAFGGTLNASITVKTLTVSGIKGVTRVYNGSTGVEIDANEVALVGVCAGDEVTVDVAGASAVSANKNVGTHSVQVSGLALDGKDASNYTLVAPTDVKATITKKEIHVTYEKDSYTYDGTAKIYNKNLVQLNASDIISGEEVNAGSLTGNVATNVGTYQVKLEALTGSDAMNYAIAEGESGELEIKKTENEVTVDIAGWTYGKSANAPTAKALFGEESVAYTYSEDGENWTVEVPVNAGNYMVRATVPETTNYAEASATKAFVIEKATIKVTADDGMVVRNGEALPVITYTVAGDFVEADRAALDEKIEVSTDADITKAGKYQTIPNWKNESDVLGNYNVTFVEGTFTVTRNDTVVNAEGYTGIYGGQNDDHGITVEVVGDSGAAVYYTAAEGFDSEINALVANVHDAYDKSDEEFEAAYTALATALATKNYELTSPVMHDAQVADIHYIVITDQSKPDVIVGTETVEIKPAALTVIAKDRAIVYGDPAETADTEISEKIAVDGLVEGETEDVLDMSAMTFDYQNYTEEPEVGAYAITASGLKEAEGKHNYEATYKTGTLTVNPKVVELEWTTPSEFNYNGTERSVTAEVTNAILGDVISVAAYTNNAKTEVGDYTATATELTGAKAKNYTLTGSESASYAWSVVPFSNMVNVSVEDWTYGDMANEAVVTAELDADKAVVEFFTDEACENKTTAADGAASVGGRPSYAGTYYVKATLERTDLYEGSFSIDEFVIGQREITVQADNKASTHGETLKPLTYQLGGMAYGTDDLGIVLTTEAASTAAAGEYEITVTTSDDAHITRNYDITPVNGTYTITKAKMGVSAEGYIGNYDGKAHGIKVTLDPNEEGKATIYYATEELTVENYKTVGTKSATAESVTVKDAGTKTIYYFVESRYYEGEPAIAGSVDVTVNKIELTVTANENTITYGDEAENAGVTYSGFIAGEDESDLDGALSYRYEKAGVEYAEGSNVGEYDIIPFGLDSANYEISYVSGVMTVEPKAVTFTWSENSYVYDAEAHRPTATIANALNGDDVNVNSYNGNEETNVGAYVTEVLSIAGSDAANYVMLASEKSISHNWKITKSDNAWNIEPAISDWTYGKTASIPTSVAKLGKDTVVYEYKKAGLLHILDSYTSEVPTEAGNYIMRATVPGTENYREIKATVDFQIKPAEIVIGADDKISMYRTALLPLSYTVSGDYVEGDELGIVLSTDATLLSSVGEYDINANWDENPNYSATISKGTYSITKGYLNISASDVSAVYD